MTANPVILPCANCGKRDSAREFAPRLARCDVCDFISPQSHETRGGLSNGASPGLAGIAPGGVIRGKYRLLERLGEGAHGVSYLAEHEYLSHLCVVKVLPHRIGDATDAAVTRLRNEARAGFRVHHPNVVRVLDCDVVSGIWYFVMEYIDGVNLAEILATGQRLNWLQAVNVARDAAEGLAAIHAVGLLHRDIKPANLILGTDGRVRVADLGVAGLAHERLDPPLAGGATQAGTLAYTAPEMFQPDSALGPQTDLYSLGVTLFHLLTGRLPHPGNQVFQRLIDLQCRPAEWPADVAQDVPEWLVKVLLRLLAIEPAQRLNTPTELIAHLKLAESEPPKLPRPEPLDTLQPRGIGVLPFENAGESADDDWLGYALANYLSRALAETRGVYVADQDGLVAMTQRLERAGGKPADALLLEAGRMVGAGTIVTGRFRCVEGAVRVNARALRYGGRGTTASATQEDSLANLGNLERRLFDNVARMLGIGPGLEERIQTAGPGAREKFVLSKQAYLRGEYENAISLAEEAIRLAPDFAEAIGFVGVCLARIGRYDDAELQHRKEEALATQWGDARREVEALANLGAMYYFRGDYEAAELHYTRAGAMAEQLGLATEQAQVFNNLGFVLFRLGRLSDAEGVFLRAIETHRAYGGLTLLVGPYNGMGNVLVEQKRYKDARSYYRRALALATETGDRTSVGTTHMHLGRCAALDKHFADAKHEFTMALNALEETRFWNGLARAYEYIADMHLQLGNHEEAIRCADQRINLARQHSNVRMESAAWLQKAETLESAGRSVEAAACRARVRSDM